MPAAQSVRSEQHFGQPDLQSRQELGLRRDGTHVTGAHHLLELSRPTQRNAQVPQNPAAGHIDLNLQRERPGAQEQAAVDPQ